MMHRLALVAVLAVALGACGSSKPSTTEGGTTGGGTDTTTGDPADGDVEAPPDIGEGVAWADKSHDQKKAFMKAKVVPAVAAIWGESPEPDEEVDCTVCHGEGVMEGEFDMPNPKLPVLNPANEFAAHHDDADWLEFMGTKLVPTMVETLDVEPFNMETYEGFGCFACHTMEQGDGA